MELASDHAFNSDIFKMVMAQLLQNKALKVWGK
jgi:hypothetical protein